MLTHGTLSSEERNKGVESMKYYSTMVDASGYYMTPWPIGESCPHGWKLGDCQCIFCGLPICIMDPESCHREKNTCEILFWYKLLRE